MTVSLILLMMVVISAILIPVSIGRWLLNDLKGKYVLYIIGLTLVLFSVYNSVSS